MTKRLSSKIKIFFMQNIPSCPKNNIFALEMVFIDQNSDNLAKYWLPKNDCLIFLILFHVDGEIQCAKTACICAFCMHRYIRA